MKFSSICKFLGDACFNITLSQSFCKYFSHPVIDLLCCVNIQHCATEGAAKSFVGRFYKNKLYRVSRYISEMNAIIHCGGAHCRHHLNI